MNINVQTGEVRLSQRTPTPIEMMVVVGPRDYYRYYRNSRVTHVTIVARMPNGTAHELCRNLRLMANRSVVVTANGRVKPQKYGGYLFEDEDGCPRGYRILKTRAQSIGALSGTRGRTQSLLSHVSREGRRLRSIAFPADYYGFLYVNHDFTAEQVRKYGKIYGSYRFTQKCITINEPDLLRDIMVRDFHVFPDRRYFHLGSSKIGKSLFFLPGSDDDWKRVRSILSPVFTSGKLRAMMRNISGISDKFVNNLSRFAEQGEPVDMRKYVGAFAMDVISACAYGINVESIDNPNHPIVTNAMKILNTDAGVGIMLSVMIPQLGRLLRAEPFDIKAVKYFDDLTNQILSERKVINKYSASDTKRRTDFIQLMIDSEKSDKESEYYSGGSDVETDETIEQHIHKRPMGTLSADELTAQGILFFIAGYDTTSAAITHAIYYLSQNKDCQQKLYEELQSCDEFTYEKLAHFKYLNAVISETLRLAPSLTRIQRESLTDYKLGNTGITIPKGTSVEIVPYTLHRQPDLWPNPNDFIPDRFLEPTHHPYAYIPFGGGPRVCIGQRFAMQEMRMCLAKLIKQFEFDPVDKTQTKLEYFTGSLLMSPKELMVNIKSRSTIGKSLLFLPGSDDDWKRVRSILSPVFTSGKLRAMMRNISGIFDKFVNNLFRFVEKGEPVNMRKYVGAFAMDVISACAYGINVESIDNPNHPIVTNAMKILNTDAGVGIMLLIIIIIVYTKF
ncbi:unnamed protein product [Medioppia subpectinata]|uniref:Cytochrome P450 n=1 Tax=Medioppia subpectinata TaxID=1979941 RepID=A0A7R9Q1W6_9ACAR|nr:unnamed protein product [Medioppia subpectinata]CAG2108825.1 unnamed protein product [Medioppia subpectinata]